jgi:hypothetical protein
MKNSPSDATVAARSFPRRWQAVFARAVGDPADYRPDDDDALHRSGIIKLANQAAQRLEHAAHELPGTALPKTQGARGVLDLVEVAAGHLAEVIESVPADAWDNATIDLLNHAIDEVASLLRQADQAVDAALATQ